jgi:hypothetical protein
MDGWKEGRRKEERRKEGKKVCSAKKKKKPSNFVAKLQDLQFLI